MELYAGEQTMITTGAIFSATATYPTCLAANIRTLDRILRLPNLIDILSAFYTFVDGLDVLPFPLSSVAGDRGSQVRRG